MHTSDSPRSIPAQFLTVIRLFAMLVIVGFTRWASAQTPLSTAIKFSRTGMKLNGNLLNGTFDFKFKLLDAQTGGNLVGQTVSINALNVSNGSMPTQSLDFGPDAFNGEARFVQVIARQGTAQFKSVGARTELIAVPYALALPGFFTVTNDSAANIVGGYAGNTVSDAFVGQTISGGGGDGVVNSVTGAYGTIGGGRANAAGQFATVSGGIEHAAAGDRSTIGGGSGNDAAGFAATVGGGLENSANAGTSTVGGGTANTATGNSATVPGGANNLAAGNFSFAAGFRAKANAAGTFVWADSTNADFAVGGANRFSVRASGGAEIFTNAGITTGVFLSPGSGTWSTVSDRNLKANLQPVDVKEALERVLRLPISTWNYTSQDQSIRHIGPMSQDFHAEFGLGESDRHITTVDADGVALAAIQGLHAALLDRDAAIERQRQQLHTQAAEIARLGSQLQALQSAVLSLQAELPRSLHPAVELEP